MGGTGSGYIPGQWQCLVCGVDKCWPARPRCYPRGTPRQIHGGGHQGMSLCWSRAVSPLQRKVVTHPLPVLRWSLGWCLVLVVRLLQEEQGLPRQAGCLAWARCSTHTPISLATKSSKKTLSERLSAELGHQPYPFTPVLVQKTSAVLRKAEYHSAYLYNCEYERQSELQDHLLTQGVQP